MAVTQYIGARYVPMVYDNPDGTNNWLQGVAYEPLTVVVYAGNSYTSKKVVPANIGAPNLNPEYWASTGIYNAQVETIRQGLVQTQQDLADTQQDLAGTQQDLAGTQQDLDAIEADFAAFKMQYYNFKGRKVLFVGDSYSEGWTPDGTNEGWSSRVISLINLQGAVIRHKGGIGFTSTIDGVSFYNIADDVSEKATFSDVVICGGRNDADSTAGAIINAVEGAITHYQSMFTNAKIHVGMIAYALENTNVDITKVFTAYKRGTQNKAAHYLYGCEMALSNGEYMASDGRHPNIAGQIILSQAIATALKNGMYSQLRDLPTATRNATIFNYGTMAARMIGDQVRVIWTDFKSSVAIPINKGQTTSVKMADHDFGIRNFGGYTLIPAMAIVVYGNPALYVTVPCIIKITRNEVLAEFLFSTPNGADWAGGSINYITIRNGSAMVSVWD